MTQQNPRNKPFKIIIRLVGQALALALLSSVSFGQLVRGPNATVDFPVDVQNTGEFVLSNALPGLTLHQPVTVKTPPGETNRLFIVERAGRILVVNDLASPTGEVFLDIRDRVHASTWAGFSLDDRRTEGLSSLAFHPGFATNGRIFVTYNTVTETSQGAGHHNRISEFRATEDLHGTRGDSEIPYITQFDEGAGHNFNDLHFGPDGYLYVALGDEGDLETGDDYNNAQKIDKDFFSGIIRIDVDDREGSLPPNPHPASHGNYRIPADNPFVGAVTFLGSPLDPPAIRTEFYAVGLRNVWRIAFDPETGELYAADVGQHDREEVNRIVKGGNYGWSFKQGTLNGPKGPAPEGFQFIEPIWEYSPADGRSITGGVVYRGSRFPALRGHYIFADFQDAHVWAMDVTQNPVGRPKRLLSESFLAGFGYDPRNGDVLFVKHGNPEHPNTGQILRLTAPQITVEFPAKLSDTGIFEDLRSLKTEEGIVPYDLNLPFWSDGAIKTRWFSLPDTNAVFTFRPEQNWVLPPGAIWIKHFELETEVGNPESRKRVETRVLVRTAGGGYGLTYRWNDEQTNADLVGDGGATDVFIVTRDGETKPQVWEYPSRQECLRCHTEAGGFALGFNTAQLNRNFTHGTVSTNQIMHLTHAGYLANAPDGPHGLRSLAALDDESVSRTYRVKSYLAANCAYCHQPGGTAQLNAFWDGRITTPLSKAGVIWGALYDNAVADEKVVTPGQPGKSGLVRRISTLDHQDRMPPIGSSVVDQKAVDLLTAWIQEDTPGMEWYNQWTARVFSEPKTNTVPEADPDHDGAANYAEYLIGSHPTDNASKLAISTTLTNGHARFVFTNPPNRAVVFESAENLAVTNWTTMQNEENQMVFPAEPARREIRESAARPQRIYRARVVEP